MKTSFKYLQFPPFADDRRHNEAKKMKYHLYAVIAAAIVSIFLCSCGGLNEQNPPLDESGNSEPLSSIDIVGAKALFLAPSSVSPLRFSAKETGTTNTLFKITENGLVVEVTLTDEDGGEVTDEYTPSGVADAGDTYMIVTFESVPDYAVPAFLVRKTDGAVFSLDNVGWPRLSDRNFINSKSVQTDSNGSIYYSANHAAADAVVMKIDVSDPENITAVSWSPEPDAPNWFVISPDGHLAYAGRIKKANGGLHNMPEGVIWVGLDGNFRYQDPEVDLNSIYTVHIDVDYNLTTSLVTGIDIPHLGWAYSGYILRLSDRVYIIPPGSNNPVEVENPTNTPRLVTISEIDEISIAACSSTNYFLSGLDSSNNPLLLKVEPGFDTVTTLLPRAGVYYDIFKMVVSPDGVVTFNALRMSDGVKVLGEVDADGNVTILDESLNVQVVTLERVF